ncbi:hypothetical protein M404DRAFT_26537 [Pisolithus tinctorius Marx 270]|uniref:Uncharacterized protein n=1 Tax=Pisolithus tinctorius Marx 270 TaxID=870435 RepID=A0A0C3NSS3_PISTI|nr:hypothetical protein M404DRAFT_26537 [Pisolithus tinctorius Marx 270]
MHLTGNISNLLLSLWHGMIDHADSDDPEHWPWAVLADEEVWRTHGEAVMCAGFHLPGSYDCKPHNIAKKINTQYKTWEFQLYMFALAPILLYSILPSPFWENYCKLICSFQIMCQSTLTKDKLLDAHALLCSWEHEFELTYYASSSLISTSFALASIKSFIWSPKQYTRVLRAAMPNGLWNA